MLSPAPGQFHDMSTTVSIVLSLLCSLLCCVGTVFLFLLILGVVLLRRRGKKVTPKAAVKAATERVSQAFMRGPDGKIQGMDDDDDD